MVFSYGKRKGIARYSLRYKHNYHFNIFSELETLHRVCGCERILTKLKSSMLIEVYNNFRFISE